LPAILEGAGLKYTVIEDAGQLFFLENVIRDAFENLRPI